ncbi:MAG: hypothetical protein IT443_04030 [Phycisphaeraceae bacterium]|nr:hypothetical protein [Phycisphaeraceae bacterium]
MPLSDVQIRALLLLLLIVLLGLGGMLWISAIVRSWRRFQDSNRARKHRLMPDLWQAGGDRLVARLQQEEFNRRAEAGEFEEEDNDDDTKDLDDDDQDEDHEDDQDQDDDDDDDDDEDNKNRP